MTFNFVNCLLLNTNWFSACVGKVITITDTSLGTITGVLINSPEFNDVSPVSFCVGSSSSSANIYYNFSLDFDLVVIASSSSSGA